MNSNYFEDKVFRKLDFRKDGLPHGDYEGCAFDQCNFSNTDLSGILFSECTFTGCNLGMCKVLKTSFQDVVFKDCKLLGMHFSDCNAFIFTVQFDRCILNLASFYLLKLKKGVFKDCSLHEVDFTETDLTASVLDNCDLAKALFDNTILEKADLRTSYNYSIDPERNRIRKARFSTAGIAGLLDKYELDIE